MQSYESYEIIKISKGILINNCFNIFKDKKTFVNEFYKSLPKE
jgi:hypothetical protein